MQRVTLVRYTAKPDRAAENERLARTVFTKLKQATPPHITYTLFQNNTEFVHLFINTKDDDAGPLIELAGFKAYAKDVAERCEAPPEPLRLTGRLLESYGLVGMMETV